jgi:hypothetical protein
MLQNILDRVFKNPKSSSLGVATCIVTVLGFFGVGINPETALSIVGGVLSIGALFIKDS